LFPVHFWHGQNYYLFYIVLGVHGLQHLTYCEEYQMCSCSTVQLIVLVAYVYQTLSHPWELSVISGIFSCIRCDKEVALSCHWTSWPQLFTAGVYLVFWEAGILKTYSSIAIMQI
jgi:hypothetical protein